MTAEELERHEAEQAEALLGRTPAEDEEEVLIPALFASDLKQERHEVPGHPGSWIEVQGMGGEALTEWMEGEGLKVIDGKVQLAGNMSVTRQELELMLNTLTDYCLVRRKQGVNDPESWTDEQTRPPGVERESPHWREFTKQVLVGRKGHPREGLTFAFRSWIVQKCLGANGLLPGQRKN